MQSLIGKKDSFEAGIALLLELREELFAQLTSIVNTYPKNAFSKMPFSRHWIMHIEAMVRIRDGLCKKEEKA